MTAAEIADACGLAQRSGQWWRCRCPAHGSRTATLALRDGERSLIVCCHAGCEPRDVLAALRRLGLDAAGSYDPPEADREHERQREARRSASASRIWDAAEDARRSPVAAYLAGRGVLPCQCPRRCAGRHPCGVQTARTGRAWWRASPGRAAR